MKKLLIFALLLGAVGCKKPIAAVHPGSISNLDSYSYDILLVEQDVIAEARAQYVAGKLPTEAKPALNTAIAEYNIAQAAWHAYHEKHAGNETVLQDAINALVGAVGQLQQILGKTPAPVSWIPALEVYA